MGLDTVELVIQVEEAFAVTIPDDVAIRLQTVGDLQDWLVEQTRSRTCSRQNRCLSAATFYGVRRAIIEQWNLECRPGPNAEINDLIPPAGRESAWQKLAETLKVKLPPLDCWRYRLPETTIPSWLGFLILFGIAGTMFFWPLWAGVLLFAIVLLALIAFKSATGTWVSTPVELTLGQLTHQLLMNNFELLSQRHQCWSENDVWHTLRGIIVYQLGITADGVTREASFVNDLGMD